MVYELATYQALRDQLQGKRSGFSAPRSGQPPRARHRLRTRVSPRLDRRSRPCAASLTRSEAAGCARWFRDTASASLTEQPQLMRALEKLRDGEDTVVSGGLDRLGRSSPPFTTRCADPLGNRSANAPLRPSAFNDLRGSGVSVDPSAILSHSPRLSVRARGPAGRADSSRTLRPFLVCRGD